MGEIAALARCGLPACDGVAAVRHHAGFAGRRLGVLFYSLILGTICLTLIGAIGSALTVSIRRGGLLMSLLTIPLNVPVLIFGTAVSEAVIGGNPQTWLTLLGGNGSLALVPLAISAALRVSLDN